jgi:hypothetical protein
MVARLILGFANDALADALVARACQRLILVVRASVWSANGMNNLARLFRTPPQT